MFFLPDLPYAYDELEPYIDARTLEIHHSKHHANYVNQLNVALEGQHELADKSIEWLLSNLEHIPESIRTAVRNNGGGHYNHSLFWSVMSPTGGGEPIGELAEAIAACFGNFKNMKEMVSQAAIRHFGSGYGWLVFDNGKLEVMSTSNQDTPLAEGKIPLMVIDVWEHAYYLKYQNKRPDFVSAWWNVVNWREVEKRYQEAKERMSV
ncbi:MULTISPECIES: superoxide dismutase [Aneurinibacillus]|uniref:Superoxide dismutase n=1 Tax=Aneurinibacillus thermoaerophilus TaxID=143495 RepID=A0A1G7W5T9_ANETH|nr:MULTISPECIES: superoxide dismutase [Aneurinibacillus]AMA72531.1 superoxide dismutase [Aneurinibacillus sp. XH2]MED0675575.1 superoxide dismutase [Aneurinibacillus thermoaerophilus]MED0681314.1 superoxide dismutase [Aneurinibacillus thermoaerophilus]MED0735476.1 superoxide dismutase [Aneurinibacillus thermoaerophilus]MED0756640.1 superoxide dismutase [Aneurinibacillus thermoaerophilus]